MRNPTTPLLCELHAHTTWSDGSLSVRELVDLYGGSPPRASRDLEDALLPAEQTEDAVLAYLRSRDPVALMPFRPPAEAIRRAA